MRQFILGKNVAYASTVANLTLVPDGAVGVFYDKDGTLTVSTDGTDVNKEAMLVLGRKAELGGPVVLPIYKNNFSFVKGVYQAASTFEYTVTIPAPKTVGDYTLIIAKKGVKFNERNKWTATVHVKDTSMVAEELAIKLVKQITNNSIGSEVEVTYKGETITVKAKKAGVDYALIPADLLYGVQPNKVHNGIPAYGDAKYVKDLADKAAADAGFEYTYRDAYVDLYPNYPLNPLAQPDGEDKGYTIFTLRFAEPRQVKTRDEVVNQIVQVAFPTGASAITTFETVCKGLAGEDTAEEE